MQRGQFLWTWDATVMGLFSRQRTVSMIIAGFPLPDTIEQSPGGGVGDDAAQPSRMGLLLFAPLLLNTQIEAWLADAGQVVFIIAPSTRSAAWAAAAKEAHPAALLVMPLAVSRALRRAVPAADVRVGPLAGAADMPGLWPRQYLDLITVRCAPLCLVFRSCCCSAAAGGREGPVGGAGSTTLTPPHTTARDWMRCHVMPISLCHTTSHYVTPPTRSCKAVQSQMSWRCCMCHHAHCCWTAQQWLLLHLGQAVAAHHLACCHQRACAMQV